MRDTLTIRYALAAFPLPFVGYHGGKAIERSEHEGAVRFGEVRVFLRWIVRGLPGVLAAWFMGKDGWGWSEGGKRFAWLGCLFFLVLGAVMVLTGGVFVLLALVTGNATVNVS